VKTEMCYCGQIGCVERIFSRRFLGKRGSTVSFEALINQPKLARRTREMIDHTARAIANAVNFVRPVVLLIATSMNVTGAFRTTLETAIKAHTLAVLQSRLRIAWQPWSPEMSAAAAGALPMSNLLQWPR